MMRGMIKYQSWHDCVFCKSCQTDVDYYVGITTANGEKYEVRFPSSILHYLERNIDKHDWSKKGYYHPPEYFIEAIENPKTVFSFPPDEEERKDSRCFGYLSSIQGMINSFSFYGPILTPLPVGLQTLEIKSKEDGLVKLDDLIDTQGGDPIFYKSFDLNDSENVWNDYKEKWLAVIKPEKLDEKFIHNLKKFMNVAERCSEFKIDPLDTCKVHCSAMRSEHPQAKHEYELVYNQDKNNWSLYRVTKVDTNPGNLLKDLRVKINISIIPNLQIILSKITDPLNISNDEEKAIKKAIYTYQFRNVIYQGYTYDPQTGFISVTMEETLSNTSYISSAAFFHQELVAAHPFPALGKEPLTGVSRVTKPRINSEQYAYNYPSHQATFAATHADFY
jgi:hypothetical protein